MRSIKLCRAQTSKVTIKWVAISIAAFGLLSACDDQVPLGDDQVLAPGLDTNQPNMDPFLVGQRLMNAGEYELALKSFFRAGGERGLTAPILASIGTANLGLARLGQAEDALRRAIAEDQEYVPAWNNLGAVLMEKREWGEAARVLQTAFALDSGESVEIRENLRKALENLNEPVYSDAEEPAFALVRRGSGDYLLMSTE